MIYTKEDRPERLQSAKLIVEELLDELMVYDPARNKAFCLNQTAAYVWKHADGKTTVNGIAAMMAQELGKPVNEQVVWYALDLLAKDGLLAPVGVQPPVPAGVTRRALLQTLGMGAAAAVPLVTVLTIAPSKAHASGKGHSDWDWNGDGWKKGKGNGNSRDWFTNIFHF